MEKLTQSQRLNIRKKQVLLLRGGCCSKCGYQKNVASLVFHHLDPATKEFCLNALVLAYESWERIQIELEKCVVLCHNCHNELHHPSGDWTSIPDLPVDFVRPPRRRTLCQDCGEEVINAYQSKRCPECNNRKRERANWPAFTELVTEINNTSVAAVARQLGVSPQAVRARIKRRIAVAKDTPVQTCSLCDRKHYAKGFCQKHWQAQRHQRINNA